MKLYKKITLKVQIQTLKILQRYIVSKPSKVAKKLDVGSIFDMMLNNTFGDSSADNVLDILLDRLQSGEYILDTPDKSADDTATLDSIPTPTTVSVSENTEVIAPKIDVSKPVKVIENRVGGPTTKHKGPVATSTSQIMSYVTVKNIETDTSYKKEKWTLFVLKELIDNAYDWLNEQYPVNTNDKEVRKIGVRIWITSDGNGNSFIHIAVRNSNVSNVLVFLELDQVFNYHIWYSTKRYQNNMTTGSLGDALKRCLGMGYALYTDGFNSSDTFEDKQYNEPIIVRCNAEESRVFIKVDTSKPDITTDIQREEKPSRNIGTDTEVEVTLPLLDCNTEQSEYAGENKRYFISELEQYYLNSKMFKRNVAWDYFCSEGQ